MTGDARSVGSELADAIEATLDARRAEREARGDDPGYDWDYFGSEYFARIEAAEIHLGETLLALFARPEGRAS